MRSSQLFDLLELNYERFNNLDFIEEDPISIPHRFTEQQDIEIAGFFAATLAWGQRKTIVSKSSELMELMEDSPYEFVLNHSEGDLKRLLHFKHRTFNTTDLLYFIHILKRIYTEFNSMEHLFIPEDRNANIRNGIEAFHQFFTNDPDFPARTRKHIASPARKSACKRLNMFLRWMVRKDASGVDFGIWKGILPEQLICPFDVHVEKVARHLKLITRKQRDWQTAEELTCSLKEYDPKDPVKYDFALFGLGLTRQI